MTWGSWSSIGPKRAIIDQKYASKIPAILYLHFFTQCMPLRLLHASGDHMSFPLFCCFICYAFVFVFAFVFLLTPPPSLPCLLLAPGDHMSGKATTQWPFPHFCGSSDFIKWREGIKKKYATTTNILTNLASTSFSSLSATCARCSYVREGGKGKTPQWAAGRHDGQSLSFSQGCQGGRTEVGKG